MQEKILITAIGSMSAEIVISTCKAMGLYTVGCDTNPQEWLANGCEVDEFIQCPIFSSKEYLPFIFDLIKKEDILYILPLTDPEVDVLSRERKRIEEMGACVLLPETATVELCRNKLVFQEYLHEQRIDNTISTISCAALTEDYMDIIRFPSVVKPIDGRSSEGLFYITDFEELSRVLTCIEPENYIIQPQIGGEGCHVVTVDVIRQKECNRFAAMARRELLRTANGAGLTVEIFQSDELISICRRIAEAIDLCGCVNFEFIEENGQYYILECNPRFSGGVEFSCMSGYDFIANHLRCFRREPIDLLQELRCQVIARRYKAYITNLTSRKLIQT